MNVDSIKNGIVIDHIKAGKGHKIYNFLGLDSLNCSIALLKNVPSEKMGKKDIIKIDDESIVLDLEVLGYLDPGITVAIIRDGKVTDKHKVKLPETLVNVLKCKNPRCIVTTEQELDHIFELVDAETRTYRCKYCDSHAK